MASLFAQAWVGKSRRPQRLPRTSLSCELSRTIIDVSDTARTVAVELQLVNTKITDAEQALEPIELVSRALTHELETTGFYHASDLYLMLRISPPNPDELDFCIPLAYVPSLFTSEFDLDKRRFDDLQCRIGEVAPAQHWFLPRASTSFPLAFNFPAFDNSWAERDAWTHGRPFVIEGGNITSRFLRHLASRCERPFENETVVYSLLFDCLVHRVVGLLIASFEDPERLAWYGSQVAGSLHTANLRSSFVSMVAGTTVVDGACKLFDVPLVGLAYLGHKDKTTCLQSARLVCDLLTSAWQQTHRRLCTNLREPAGATWPMMSAEIADRSETTYYALIRECDKWQDSAIKRAGFALALVGLGATAFQLLLQRGTP